MSEVCGPWQGESIGVSVNALLRTYEGHAMKKYHGISLLWPHPRVSIFNPFYLKTWIFEYAFSIRLTYTRVLFIRFRCPPKIENDRKCEFAVI